MRYNPGAIRREWDHSDGIRKNRKKMLTDRIGSTFHTSDSQEIRRTNR